MQLNYVVIEWQCSNINELEEGMVRCLEQLNIIVMSNVYKMPLLDGKNEHRKLLCVTRKGHIKVAEQRGITSSLKNRWIGFDAGERAEHIGKSNFAHMTIIEGNTLYADCLCTEQR